MAEELKACPFCGGEPNLTHSDYVHDDLRPMPVVECKSCSAWVRAEDWNHRAQLPSQGGEAVEVVASIAVDAEGVVRDFTLEPGLDRHPGGYTVTPLMTVAQHQRILAAATHPAGQVADDLTMVKVSRERIANALEAVQNAMEDAYNNAYQDCCGRGQGECCGNPVAGWSDVDQAIMDALAPAQRELSALLANDEGVKA